MNFPLQKFSKFHGKFKICRKEINYQAGKSKSSIVIKASSVGTIRASELKTLVITLKKKLRRRGVFFVRIFPYLPLTMKPNEVRMGKGKGGKFRDNVVFVVPGQILFEFKFLSLSIVLLLLKAIQKKISIRIFVSRQFLF